MPPKISSLKNQKEFSIVSSLGKKIYRPHFISIISPNLGAEVEFAKRASFFLGMKVTKKIGNAVLRNKIKRRIRHCFRELTKADKLKEKSALVIIPKKDFDKLEFSFILSELTKIFSASQNNAR